MARDTFTGKAGGSTDMTIQPVPSALPPASPRRRWHRVGRLLTCVIGLYLLVAYVAMPAAWNRYERRHHASVDGLPRITQTGAGIPGDPLNVALVGTETQVKKLMLAARWYPADALTWASCLAIAVDSVFKRPDADAPVSNLYLWGRKQDLAFEQAVGDSPRHRHHVRFWRAPGVAQDGRPLWVGSAVFDKRVGLSRTTGQVTHVTAANVDAERDKLFADLEKTGDLVRVEQIRGFHKVLKGRGGGDPWHTDGTLFLGVIAPEKNE